MTSYEKLNLNCSNKNIPISNKKEYKLKLIEQIRKFSRIRRKVHFSTENEDTYISNVKENYGFKSKYLSKLNNELKKFEDEMFDLVKTIKFSKINDKSQEQ